jgi:molybdopterin synthase catalytic subunit
VVRALEMGREIEGIDYEANRPMAEHQLRNIAEEAVKKFGVNHFIVSHRLGFVRAGEASLFLRVTSQNRAEAFAASQWAVDELKKRVPIWKQPRFKGETLQKKQAPKFETQPIVQK